LTGRSERGAAGVEWVLRRAPAISRSVAYLAALLVAAPFVYHLAHGSLAYLGLLEDDYFYYAIIADKFVTLGKLTYDGVTSTNGFHPLWFGIVVLLRILAGGLNGAFYGMLTAAFLASMIAAYELSRAFARALGASAALAPAVAVVHGVATDIVVSSGMETAVDVPLLLWLFVELARDGPVTPRRAAKLGAIASLAILARLDVALVVPMFFLGWLVFARPSFSRVWPAALSFCAAGLAVPLYAAFNLGAFGSVLPMSALAKQLVKHRGVNISYLRIAASGTLYGRTAGITLVLGAVAAVLLWRRPAGRGPALFTGALALVFAGVFFAINTLSGWTFFGWYAYPLAPALVAALTLLGVYVAPRLRGALSSQASAAVVVAAAAVAGVQGAYSFATRGPLYSVSDNGLLAMSVELAETLRDRQGVFAMGAIAGFATYLLKQPVVQLEGLVGDRSMIDHVRREDELGAVLAEHHVDYLIVSTHHAILEKRDGCYVVTQPNAEWSGKRVDRMYGELCAEPVVYFPTRLPSHTWSSFSTLDTYVFDLRGASWRASSALQRDPSPPARPAAPASPVGARPYGYYVPPSYRADRPAPLLIALHGLGGSGADVAAVFDLHARADEDGFLYAFPDGTPSARWGRFWNATDACCNFDAPAVDDVAYLRAVIDDMASRYAVDPRRIDVVGLSNGGYMAHRAACDMADRVAAVVSVSGANWKDPEACKPSEPVAVLEVHSDADPIVRYEGKAFVIDGRLRTLPSAHETVATWARRDGCGGPLARFGAPVDWDSAVPGAETTMERYSSCSPDGAVELWTVHGGDHVPGPGRSVGELTMGFLASHPKMPRGAPGP
jgi:polyhydroxybutyrate depolymerase